MSQIGNFNDSGEFNSTSNMKDAPQMPSKADRERLTKRDTFINDLRKDIPDMEAQAEFAKRLPGRDEYLEAREKSEQAKRDYPHLKDWELSPEQLSEAHENQTEIAARLKDGCEDGDASDLVD